MTSRWSGALCGGARAATRGGIGARSGVVVRTNDSRRRVQHHWRRIEHNRVCLDGRSTASRDGTRGDRLTCMASPAPMSATPATTVAANGRPTLCQRLSTTAADPARAHSSPRTIAARPPRSKRRSAREKSASESNGGAATSWRPGPTYSGGRQARGEGALPAAALPAGWPPRERSGWRHTPSRSPFRHCSAGCSRVTAGRTAAGRRRVRFRTATERPRALRPSSG